VNVNCERVGADRRPVSAMSRWSQVIARSQLTFTVRYIESMTSHQKIWFRQLMHI